MVSKPQNMHPIFPLFCDEDEQPKHELFSLLSKEKDTHLGELNGVLMDLRKDCVDWMIRVSAHFGFLAVTTILGVNYFDRFLSSPCFQRDKPWMSQLAAVACLSLASKVEEIQTPLLLDLQVEGSKFVFESKTIMKMELLVLSFLQWKMNPVTPFTFFDIVTRRLGLAAHCLHSEFERIILSVINDSRVLSFRPSEIAMATMCLVFEELVLDDALDYQSQLKGILEINEEKLDNCSKFILEASNNHRTKRKYHSAPVSPKGITEAYFSSDNSNDSWVILPSPEPPFKKTRAHEQQMRLVPVNRVENPR